MQHEPQLKKTIKMSVTSGVFQFEWDLEVYEKKCIQFIKTRNGELGYREFELKDELATALEEQRAEYAKWVNDKIAKCEKLKDSEYASQSPDYFRGKMAMLNDLSAILNGKDTT